MKVIITFSAVIIMKQITKIKFNSSILSILLVESLTHNAISSYYSNIQSQAFRLMYYHMRNGPLKLLQHCSWVVWQNTVRAQVADPAWWFRPSPLSNVSTIPIVTGQIDTYMAKPLPSLLREFAECTQYTYGMLSSTLLSYGLNFFLLVIMMFLLLVITIKYCNITVYQNHYKNCQNNYYKTR